MPTISLPKAAEAKGNIHRGIGHRRRDANAKIRMIRMTGRSSRQGSPPPGPPSTALPCGPHTPAVNPLSPQLERNDRLHTVNVSWNSLSLSAASIARAVAVNQGRDQGPPAPLAVDPRFPRCAKVWLKPGWAISTSMVGGGPTTPHQRVTE